MIVETLANKQLIHQCRRITQIAVERVTNLEQVLGPDEVKKKKENIIMYQYINWQLRLKSSS